MTPKNPHDLRCKGTKTDDQLYDELQRSLEYRAYDAYSSFAEDYAQDKLRQTKVAALRKELGEKRIAEIRLERLEKKVEELSKRKRFWFFPF